MTTQSLNPNSGVDTSPRSSSDTVRQILVLVALGTMITVNALANAVPINGQNTGEISDRFDVFFVPAGYVFSIWGLIYLALIGYGIYQALPSQAANPLLRRIGYLVVLSSLLNATWIFLWHYELFGWSMVVMIGLLLTLLATYIRIGSGERPASRREYWLVHFPFSIYLGWVSVATIANATSLLDFLNWGGWGIAPVIWGVIMLVVATVVGVAIGVLRGDIAFVGVLVWAFTGIAVKHWETPLIAYTALIMTAIVAASLLIGVPRRNQRLEQRASHRSPAASSSPGSSSYTPA